jgi:flagella basal body P-ring formation protein FlgA
MMRILPIFWAIVLGVVVAGSVRAESAVAVRTIRAQAILSVGDIELRATQQVGAFSDLSHLIGLETREVLYAGRPIQPDQVGPPALVMRNQPVQMSYTAGQLQIATEGRALGRAAAGESVRVMNMTSRNTVMAIVQGPSLVVVSNSLISN